MAKILCAYSGIEFACDHFPIVLHARESYHPIFNVPQKKLLGYLGKWSGGELTSIDSYLLFLALLNSTELVTFNVPAAPNPFTASIVAQNMEFLAKTVIKINTVYNPLAVFARIYITPDTKFLSNARDWIEVWEENYKDFLNGYKSAHDNAKLLHRERALERLIKNPYKSDSQIATQLAEWANQAASFPTYEVHNPFIQDRRSYISCAEYWKTIICMACKDDRLYAIPSTGLEDVLEYCQENIPVGSGIYSERLFRILRNAQHKNKNFLELGDYDIKTTFQILDNPSNVEEANISALIQAAPEEEPRLEQYPTKFKFMQAKMRWELAKKAGTR